MINKKEKLKVMSIINMCNAIERDNKNIDNFWLLRIKLICENFLK